jgi:hypothetical protein
MNVPRIFANAIARRVAYVVVAIALAWLGFGGEARAQDYSRCYNPNDPQQTPGFSSTQWPMCPDRGAAYAEAIKASNAMRVAGQGGVGTARINAFGNYGGGRACAYARQEYNPSVGNYDAYRCWPAANECPEGLEWDPVSQTCGGPCEGLEPIPSGDAHGPGSTSGICSDGCSYSCSFALELTIDGQLRSVCGSAWTPTGAQCAAGDPAPIPPVTDTDGDGTSDPNDNSPNNPGESGDGSNQDESRACGGEGQPECAEDGSNAGSGNGNTSGGGGNCQTPPSSTGDAILAQIAFQTWATRCAIEGNANEGTGTKPGEGKQPEWTKGEGPAAPTDDTDYVTDQTKWELPVSTDLLDQENIFGNASCPNFTIRVWTATVSTAEWGHWCTLANIMRVMITVFGAFTAIQILLGKW